MGGLGISSIPHLTITSPLVNRSCSSRCNYRRWQSPHKGCRLAPASKLIIRENPGSHPSRLTQSLQQATPPFRRSLYSQFITYIRGVKLILAQGPHGGKSILKWAGPVKSWHKTLKITMTLDCFLCFTLVQKLQLIFMLCKIIL